MRVIKLKGENVDVSLMLVRSVLRCWRCWLGESSKSEFKLSRSGNGWWAARW